jgi:hypothetical protein
MLHCTNLRTLREASYSMTSRSLYTWHLLLSPLQCRPISLTELRNVGLGSKVGFAKAYLALAPFEMQGSPFLKMQRPNTAGRSYKRDITGKAVGKRLIVGRSQSVAFMVHRSPPATSRRRLRFTHYKGLLARRFSCSWGFHWLTKGDPQKRRCQKCGQNHHDNNRYLQRLIQNPTRRTDAGKY